MQRPEKGGYEGASSRHSKIAGDFGEVLVLYLLSKYGFESAWVDHTGIDVIACRKGKKNKLGISVKTRSRSKKSPNSPVGTNENQYRKLKDACYYFDVKPWICFIADKPDGEEEGRIVFDLLSLETLKKHFNKYYNKFKKEGNFSGPISDRSIEKRKELVDKGKIFSGDFSYRINRAMLQKF